MKKVLILILVICLLFFGFMYIKSKNNNEKNLLEEKEINSSINEKINSNIAQNEISQNTEISNKTNGEITQEEAVKIAENEYGTSDIETGNTMRYVYITTVKDKNGNKYYAFRESWLVDNDHLSFLQNVFVSLDGKTIKTTSEPVNYEENQVVKFAED